MESSVPAVAGTCRPRSCHPHLCLKARRGAAVCAVSPELPSLCRVPFPAPGWQLLHLKRSKARWHENSFPALSAFASRSGCFPAWCTPLLTLGVFLVNSPALGLRSVPSHGAASAWALGLVIRSSGLTSSGFEPFLLKICWKFPNQAPTRCPGAWQVCLSVSFFFFFFFSLKYVGTGVRN